MFCPVCNRELHYRGVPFISNGRAIFAYHGPTLYDLIDAPCRVTREQVDLACGRATVERGLPALLAAWFVGRMRVTAMVRTVGVMELRERYRRLGFVELPAADIRELLDVGLRAPEMSP